MTRPDQHVRDYYLRESCLRVMNSHNVKRTTYVASGKPSGYTAPLWQRSR